MADVFKFLNLTGVQLHTREGFEAVSPSGEVLAEAKDLVDAFVRFGDEDVPSVVDAAEKFLSAFATLNDHAWSLPRDLRAIGVSAIALPSFAEGKEMRLLKAVRCLFLYCRFSICWSEELQ